MLLAIPFPDIDPALFTISLGSFQFSLRWYALAYIAGLLIGWRLMVALMKHPPLWPGAKAPLKPEEPEELLTWMVLGVVVGGRLGYVLFYDPARFIADPVAILAVWEGGMSFHGGFMGVILATILFARARGAPLLQVADAVALAAPVGLLLGRIANFINGELYGRVTDVWWAMQFPLPDPLTGARDWDNLTQPRHPSQLYEAALEGLLLLVVMWVLALYRRWLMTPGMLTGLFFIGYGLARFVVEYFREPDPQLADMVRDYGISMGQVLSLPMVAIGLGFMVVARARRAA
ncbi:MAG: prolipoprotein diacylglyceryl transferase [Pseudomonadota bacterium]